MVIAQLMRMAISAESFSKHQHRAAPPTASQRAVPQLIRWLSKKSNNLLTPKSLAKFKEITLDTFQLVRQTLF